MAYCPNCGTQVQEEHHYCGSCGQALSSVAESEDESPMVVDRDGFLSLRSLSYINDLVDGEQEIDRDSVSYKQLAREVDFAFADFARLAFVDDLNLLLLWATGTESTNLKTPVEDLNTNEFQDRLAAVGLMRMLRLYDNAFGTDFEQQFKENLQDLLDFAAEEKESPDNTEKNNNSK